MADLRHDFSQTYIKLMSDVDTKTANRIFRDLERRVKELFEQENIRDENIGMTYQMDLRYYGQEHTLTVSAPSKLTDAGKGMLEKSFDKLHLKVYGHNAPEELKEIVSFKVIGIGKVRKPALQTIGPGGKTPAAQSKLGKRKVYLGEGRYQEFSIYQRNKLRAENAIPGPAIIEEPTSTTVVEQHQICSVDQYGNLIITLEEEG